MSPSRRARVWLAGGAALGLALAAASLLRGGSAPGGRAPTGTVALVNGHPISRESLARSLGARWLQQSDPAAGVAARRSVLDALIDEELLLQRGLELDLARREPTARRAIVVAVIDTMTATAELETPDEATLRAHYARWRAGHADRDAPFEAVAEEVLADYRRERHEALLGEALRELRRSGEIVILEPELAAPGGPG